MELRLDQHDHYSDEHVVSEILHSCQDMWVILINLRPGQMLPSHASSSSVNLHVLSGECELLNGCDWQPASAGTLRFYPPSEPHGIRTTDAPASILATLAPRP